MFSRTSRAVAEALTSKGCLGKCKGCAGIGDDQVSNSSNCQRHKYKLDGCVDKSWKYEVCCDRGPESDEGIVNEEADDLPFVEL